MLTDYGKLVIEDDFLGYFRNDNWYAGFDAYLSGIEYCITQYNSGTPVDGDIGEYGDYTQSHRGEIYRTFAKKLLAEGLAYPCFLSEEEISAIREKQESEKISPGIYAGWSKYRDWDKDESVENELVSRISAGEPFVIRLKSRGVPNASAEETARHTVNDAIRGELSVPDNFLDVVIIKQTGIPTYHFAHVVDDHLMRTTHVVRGEEWLPSLPIHVELFEDL
ncbi:MAG: hypothetical protein II784_06780, partial [Oscillospiraceae bacterium]|nr:hypothetical protein [Oscillospiraceae bacterium]